MSNVAIQFSTQHQSPPEPRVGSGFDLPTQTPALPSIEGPKGLLSAQDEQALGFRIIMGQQIGRAHV